MSEILSTEQVKKTFDSYKLLGSSAVQYMIGDLCTSHEALRVENLRLREAKEGDDSCVSQMFEEVKILLAELEAEKQGTKLLKFELEQAEYSEASYSDQCRTLQTALAHAEAGAGAIAFLARYKRIEEALKRIATSKEVGGRVWAGDIAIAALQENP